MLEPTTLQGFVMNLLTDDAARSAFAADPTAVLQNAGLGDITVQDVHEVIPLVTDNVPGLDALGGVPGLDALGGGLPALDGGLPALDGALPALPDATSAIGQLQSIAQAVQGAGLPALPQVQLANPADGHLGGAVTADGGVVSGNGDLMAGMDGASVQGGVDSLLGSLTGGGTVSAEGGTGYLQVDSDQLDSSSSVAATTGGVAAMTENSSPLGSLAGDLSATTDGSFETTSHSETLLGTFDSHTEGSTDGFVSSTSLQNDQLSFTSDAAASTDGTFTSTTAADTQLGGFSSSLDGSTSGFAGSTEVHGMGATGGAGIAAGPDGVTGKAGFDSALGHADVMGVASTSGGAGVLDIGNDQLDISSQLSVSPTDGITLGGDVNSALLGDYPLAPMNINPAELGLTQLPSLPTALPALPDVSAVTSELTNTMDADMSRGAETTGGALANFVSTGGDMLAGSVSAGTNTLGQYLTGAGATPLADAVENGGAMTAGGIEHDAHTLAEHLPVDLPNLPVLPDVVGGGLPNVASLPSVGDLPDVASHLPVNLPDLGDLPDVASHLPAVGDLTGIASNLPALGDLPNVADLPSHLPVDLPNLPVANPLPDVTSVTSTVTHVTDAVTSVTHSPVTDAVSHSPVGDLTGGDHSLLGDNGILPDLHLGH